MPKQTAAERKALEEATRTQAAADAIVFAREQAPSLLIGLIGRATALDVGTNIHLDEETGKVKKVAFHRDNYPYVDSELNLDSPRWEYEYLERKFRDIVEERNRQKDKRERALNLYNGLGKADRELLEEFYYDKKGC